MSELVAKFCLSARFRCSPFPLHLNQWRYLLKLCNGKFLNVLQWVFRVSFWFRCIGHSVARLVDTPAGSTFRAYLHSVAFQPRQGSEPRVQLLKVLQCVCCELVDCRILPFCMVQMLLFSTASEPREFLAETLQWKVFQ